MLRNKVISFALLFIVFSCIIACGSSQTKEEAQAEKEELEVVDDVLKADQERADSLKKALNIED